MEFLTLDIGGVLLAVVIALVVIFLGLGIGWLLLGAMVAFLVLSAIVTWIGIRSKRRLGLGQGPRGIWNVLANGMPPVIMVVLFYSFSRSGHGMLAVLSVVGYLASVAGITADKFGSELGVLDGTPRMIFTLKKVKKGTSGGITGFGLLVGLVGSFAIALLAPIFAGKVFLSGSSVVKALVVVTAAGFVGTIVDSALGYYEEKGIGNKFTSNFICGVVAGLVAMLLFAVL
ncbi:MAG: DUF92 domain-containing protein [Candidatus Micrarchaeaceae archaeon]|jgi:uncharacterized protein (TIGR00297 family)